MDTEIVSTWQEVADHLKISVGYAKVLAKKHKDFPIFRDSRIFSTRHALTAWVERRAERKG